MKNLILILTALIFCACNKSDEMDEHFYYLGAGLQFSVVNAQNEDLLNPETPGHFVHDDIRLYYVINGEPQEYFKANLDYPRGVRITQYEGSYRISIFLNYDESEEMPITHVAWNDNDTDTVQVAYRRSDHSIIMEKIWLNGEQIWEIGDNTVDPYFILEK